MNEKSSRGESRLKALYMNENQQQVMHYEALIKNLVAECQDTI